jgi:spore cortex formation protein SpoVR/YcgB (stage V sporulation)
VDQIKSFFAVFMKYHFWVLTVLVVTIGVGGWFVASSGLAKQFETDKGTVNLKFSTIQTIERDSTHANKEMSADVRNQTLELAKSIRLAWDQLYERQRDEVLAHVRLLWGYDVRLEGVASDSGETLYDTIAGGLAKEEKEAAE